MYYYFERVSSLPDESIHMLTAVEITGASDTSFVIAVDEYPCPFFKGHLVYNMFKHCPDVTAFPREYTVYAKGQISTR